MREFLSRIRTHRTDPIFLTYGIKEQILFGRRLSAYLSSGVPILEALELIREDARTRSESFVLGRLIQAVSEGRTLSEGLRPFSRTIGGFSISLIAVGEQSGTLHQALSHLSAALRKQQALRRKFLSALAYPAMIVLATIAISAFLIIYAFPKIVPIFKGFSSNLPLTTRTLIVISDTLTTSGTYIIGSVIFVIGIFAILIRRPRVRLLLDTYVLRLPVIGILLQAYELSSLSRAFSTLLASGVAIVPALELTSSNTRNSAYARSILNARDRVLGGEKLSEALRSDGSCFPRMYLQMVATGERTGSLQPAFLALREHYEEEFDTASTNLTALIEPMLMIVMGVLVGFIALAIITPVYQITQDMHA